MMEIIGKTSVDFMGKRNIAFAISGVLVFLGILAVVGIIAGWAPNNPIKFKAKAILAMSLG